MALQRGAAALTGTQTATAQVTPSKLPHSKLQTHRMYFIRTDRRGEGRVSAAGHRDAAGCDAPACPVLAELSAGHGAAHSTLRMVDFQMHLLDT